MKMRVLIFGLLFFFFLSGSLLFSQEKTEDQGYQKYYYPNGILSSEGFIKDGKPDGYWKSYFENGKLKSQGNRKNFELDSTWQFYNEEGKLILEVNYLKGKKYGLKISYLDKETIKENFRNDIKEGFSKYYYPDGKIKTEIPFVNGMEQGFGKEYATDGTIITLTEYKKGFVVDRLRINRKDRNDLKQGWWFYFYDNGNIKLEGKYRDDRKDGYFKEYTESGDLIRISKYLNDELQPEAEEIQKLDVVNEYYPDGKVKVSAMFRNGIPEGIKREFNPEGNIEKGFLYRNGILIAEGITKEDGNRDGYWKEFFPDGSLRSDGKYDNGKQVGDWKYYHENGKIEQLGKFSKQGKPEGIWKWYFETGQLLKEENYSNGLKDGMMTEFDEAGKLIQEGEYVNGLEEGIWFEIIGDCYMRGTYRDGLRNGSWLHYYLITRDSKTDSIPSFKGNFVDDNPDGKHLFYWDNGKVKDEGLFVMGKKEGEWYKYNYDGTLFLIITYRDGVEIRYDGIKIKPPFEKEE